jgi:hypothetical protein
MGGEYSKRVRDGICIHDYNRRSSAGRIECRREKDNTKIYLEE